MYLKLKKHNPFGIELENKDALNRYSAAQYGYNNTLPMSVSSNSMYREIGFDGFEDYNSNNYYSPLYFNPHFGFNSAISSTSYITNIKSHTGKKAVVVKSNSVMEYSKRVKACDSINNQNNN